MPRRSSWGWGASEGGAFLVGLGILVSRLAGLVRQRVFAHYFGLESDAADAFTAGFRIPNFLQNLFGEGALSASFIPVYASLLAKGDRREADRVAGAVGSLLALAVALIVLVGVVATPVFTALVAPGFSGEKRDLTIAIVRVLFPGAGLLVLSAWCLGVLNSHRRFLLSYLAPVMWNVAMIATLVAFGGRTPLPDLAIALAWGSVVGSALQFGVQLPVVLRVAKDLRFAIGAASDHVRIVTRNFVPVFISRGVVQVSAYIDAMLASFLPTGALTGLQNATLLYTLPVSLFGMSVAAAELPTMSGVAVNEEREASAFAEASADRRSLGGGWSAERHAQLRARLDAGLRRIAFFVVPSAMAFLALGDVVAAALLQTGRFTHDDAVRVWAILAGSAVGLLASTLGRLYSSTYYALRDTKTPLRYAIVRVVLTTALGYLFAFPLPRFLGIPAIYGTAGLTASAGIAGWVEMLLLRSTLNTRIGRTGLPVDYTAKLWTSAALGAAVAWAVKIAIPVSQPIVAAIVILGPYGAVFFAMTAALQIPETARMFTRLRK